MSELSQDPRTRAWVVIAPERSLPPHRARRPPAASPQQTAGVRRRVIQKTTPGGGVAGDHPGLACSKAEGTGRRMTTSTLLAIRSDTLSEVQDTGKVWLDWTEAASPAVARAPRIRLPA